MTTLLADFAWCIEQIGRPLIVHRSAPVQMDEASGRARPRQDATTFEIIASLQPMTGRELDRLPEGLRNKGASACYSNTPLLSAIPSQNTVPDRIEDPVSGEIWQVEKVDDWFATAGYCLATVTRMTR